jgi:hypothetical protein
MPAARAKDVLANTFAPLAVLEARDIPHVMPSQALTALAVQNESTATAGLRRQEWTREVLPREESINGGSEVGASEGSGSECGGNS